jgi:hypothetical protein
MMQWRNSIMAMMMTMAQIQLASAQGCEYLSLDTFSTTAVA